MQVLCFANNNTLRMARLSFGSQHFQSRSGRSVLQKENAEKVATKSSQLSAEDEDLEIASDEEISTQTAHLSSSNLPILSHDKTLTKEKQLPSNENNEQCLNGPSNPLDRLYKELLAENVLLQTENKKLREENSKLRNNIDGENRNIQLHDLEKTVLSSFAKVLDAVQSCKTKPSHSASKLPISLELSKLATDEQIIPTQDLLPVVATSSRAIEGSSTVTNTSEHDAQKEKKLNDYLDLTFFKSIERPRINKRRSFHVKKEENCDDVSSDELMIANIRNSMNHDEIMNMAGNRNDAYDSKQLQIESTPGDVVFGHDMVSNSTPLKKRRKHTITDIYGDEILLHKKIKLPSRQAYSDIDTDISTAKSYPKSDQKKSGRRALSNITNKTKRSKFHEPLTLEPVEKNFFDFVDGDVLNEQTQQSVASIKKRLK